LQAVVNAVAEKLALTRLAHRELLEKQLELLIKLVIPWLKSICLLSKAI
jgi:hypothetical protein